MSNQLRIFWGIYKGFNPHTDPDESWLVPGCPTCADELLPWIDWVQHGCVGYCSTCEEFMLVWSQWEPHPDFHPRQEKDRLVAHHCTPLGLKAAGFSEEPLLWKWHESVPTTAETIGRVNALRLAHRGESDALVVLEHLLWSLIWNTECHTPQLLIEYLRFALEHPHYVELEGKSVWIGHELDLVRQLERRYGGELLGNLYSIYEEVALEPREFKKRLGFYLPTAESAYEDYSREFIDFARQARRRFAR